MGNADMTAPGDITVIGMDGSPLTSEARAALKRATLVVGGARQLRAVELPDGVRAIPLGPLDPALDALSGHDGPAAVLASGDPGFFGILRALSERGVVGEGDAAFEATADSEPRRRVRVMPAVSSVAAAFARVGLPWDDALVVSMHGAGDGRDLRRAANVCRAHPKVALLTGPGAGAAELARELLGGERTAGRDAERDEDKTVAAGVHDRHGESRQYDEGERRSNAAPHARSVRLDEAVRPRESAECGRGAERRDDEGGNRSAQSDAGSGEVGGRLGQSPAVPARRLVVAARLGEADESIQHLTLRQAAALSDVPQPHVVLCLAADRPVASRKRWLAGWNGSAGPWALPESRYDHRRRC